MKLHYFNQQKPDADDPQLAEAIRLEKVPPGCLLGGYPLSRAIAMKKVPCWTCNGPRDRCKGKPKMEESADVEADRERIRKMLTGENSFPGLGKE